MQLAASPSTQAKAQRPLVEGFPPRPLRFRRFCIMCKDAIQKEFVVGADPLTLTNEEKRRHSFEVGRFTDLDPTHAFPLCSQCAEHLAPYLDTAQSLEPNTMVIERRYYHGRVKHGRIRFFLMINGKRKRWVERLVAAISYRLLPTANHVWCDGAWLYGQGYTREYLKPREQAQFLGLNAEQQAV